MKNQKTLQVLLMLRREIRKRVTVDEAKKDAVIAGGIALR
ncbi:Variable outer membrane protein [Borrelia duttonii CR2A]|uniref:Variable large protein n=1 Tax=Borrelia duttonii CR2A TaxID=1432657 RepID=W6TFT6_9SPIR|nr:variable large family protein [Borrelia duttonii]ETZ17185.1 Variable outer membrane protein [Borrelia duttonii CR2A]